MPGLRAMKPAILERLRGVQRAGDGWLAFCPAHNDQHKRSLSVGVGTDGRTLLKCHAAGCPVEQITVAVSMTLADLAPPSGDRGRPSRREVAAYDYRNERGELLSQNVRFEPKEFLQRRPDGHGGWLWNMGGVRRVPYRLPELAEQLCVFIVEGEKDCDALWRLGLAATTNAAGAGKWTDDHTAALVSAAIPEVIVLPDNDAPGEKHARAVATRCHAARLRVKILPLAGLPPKGDISDWLDAGHGREELLALSEATPAFTPTTAGELADHRTAGPQLHREGFDLVVAWPDGVTFALTAIRDGREGVRGELTITQHGARRHYGSLALSSTSARETLRKKLEATASGLPWGNYLEQACWLLTEEARRGEPIVTLTGRVTSPTRELLPRFLYEGEPTLVYGDGDTGKSLVALTLAAAVQSGAALPCGLKPLRPAPAAYLDWETSRDTIEARLGLVAAGLGIDPPAIIYKRMARPLVDECLVLAADFARRRIGLVVIDSKMFAVAGGEGAAFHEPITAFYTALRMFAPAAVLVLNHVTNADARNGGPARPFGGAFAFNGPRLIWEAKRDPNITDATAIAFTCKKANNLPRRPEPFGLRFEPGDDTITVYPFDLTDATPSVLVSASVPHRLILALKEGPQALSALTTAVGAKQESVRKALQRLREGPSPKVTLDGDLYRLTP
jgi:hypothetical protein